MKNLLKTCARGVANLIVFPLILWQWVYGLLIGPDRALESNSQLLALFPGLSGQYLRRAFLAWVIEECHPSASIGFGTIFSKIGTRIEANVYIGPFCSIGLAHIERDVLIATAVHLTSGARMHGIDDFSRPIREQPGVWTKVRIGAGSWIGNATVVMADVGRETVVGAGSVVTKELPEFAIAAGVPAKVIRSRLENATPSANPEQDS